MKSDEDNEAIVLNKLIGGPAHGQTHHVPANYSVLQVPIRQTNKLAEYHQRRFTDRGIEYLIWCWPDLPDAEFGPLVTLYLGYQ